MTTDHRAGEVVPLRGRRLGAPARAALPPLMVQAAVTPRRARCASCTHWAPADDPARPGRCLGHHRLPATTGCDGCSAWRRRPLDCPS